jgi:hypothetical protein
MPSLTIPGVKVTGKRKKRSQWLLVFTLDGRIVKKEYEVTLGLGIDPVARLGFLIDNENLVCDMDGDWVQVVSERCMEPLCMLKKCRDNDLGAIIDQIHSEAFEDEKLSLRLNNAKNGMMDKLMWLIAFPCVTFLLIYGIRMISK